MNNGIAGITVGKEAINYTEDDPYEMVSDHVHNAVIDGVVVDFTKNGAVAMSIESSGSDKINDGDLRHIVSFTLSRPSPEVLHKLLSKNNLPTVLMGVTMQMHGADGFILDAKHVDVHLEKCPPIMNNQISSVKVKVLISEVMGDNRGT